MVQSFAWCFTENNPLSCHGDLPEWPDMRYRIFQYEKGGEGTIHIQGYVYFNKKRSTRQVSQLLARAHWESAKGNPEQNRTYCSKVETRLLGPFEWGTLPSQGKRNDLATAVDDIANGKPMEEVEGVVFVKYHRGLMAYRHLHTKHRTEGPTVYWFWGPTGTGKSERARDICAEHGPGYWKPPGKWWNDYLNEPVVVIDDLRAEDYPFQFLLRLLDKYPLSVEYKGGYAKFNSKIVVITAPGPPDYMFQDRHGMDDVAQLTRRITEVTEFNKTY